METNNLTSRSLSLSVVKEKQGLNSETNFTWVYDEIVTNFLLNEMLHHVGM